MNGAEAEQTTPTLSDFLFFIFGVETYIQQR